MINPKIEYLALFLFLICMGIIVLILTEGKKKHKHRHKRYRLNIHFHNSNNQQMANSLTLTDKNVHTGLLSVTDSVTGNTLTGTLSNIVVTDSDTTQDTATADATKPNTIDVQAVSNTGGSVVDVVADFTSQGNPGIADGTVFAKLSAKGTLVNAIPTTPQPTLNINF